MSKQIGIPQAEQEMAAMYFAMSNCAVLDLVSPGQRNIEQAYYHVSGIVESETGVSLNDEKKDWMKDCKKAKPEDYVAKEWERVKGNWDLPA